MAMKRAVSVLTAMVAVALAGLTVGAGQASAACQLQWQPDPFGESGGSLVMVCDDPAAPTGDVDGKGDGKGALERPSFASITVNMTTLHDGDTEFSGATAAGYSRRAKAIQAAVRACHRAGPGVCKSVATARDGWAVVVVTAKEDGRLVVFGAEDKNRERAFKRAEARARASFGGTPPGPIGRVRAVHSRVREK